MNFDSAAASQPFSDFMTWALYDPEQGYYARQSDQVGRGGDFFTSVSVGTLFGKILATRFAREWVKLGRPACWRISECGAHDGKLAFDVLSALRADAPDALAGLEYAICEPLQRLQAAQRVRLAEFSQVVWHAHPESLATTPLPGVVFGNELLDALPFDCIIRRGSTWLERRVAGSAHTGFRWHEAPIDNPRLAQAAAALGDAFPEGYQTEIRTGWNNFLAPWFRQLAGGLMVWLDYGFQRADYYHPSRTRGTLRTFHRHQAGEDPFECPGEQDITAHVDFTAVIDAAIQLGAVDHHLTHQGSWLTKLAANWLLSQEGRPDPSALRQFQTLTHPGHLGAKFLVLEIHVPTPH